MGTAVRNLTAVLATVEAVLSSLPLLQQAPPAASTFSLTLAGSTTLVLRAVQTAFRAGTSATLGAAACEVGAVSDDGMWMALVTPQANATCPHDSASTSMGADCGYVSLTVNTTAAGSTHYVTDAASAASSSADSADTEEFEPLGVALSCPPFCPGAVSASRDTSEGSASVVPFPLPDGTFGFATNPADVGAATPPVLVSTPESSLLSATSTGIYYALACAQTGETVLAGSTLTCSQAVRKKIRVQACTRPRPRARAPMRAILPRSIALLVQANTASSARPRRSAQGASVSETTELGVQSRPSFPLT